MSLLASIEASALECSQQFQVRQSFANGAAWEMCWEEQSREGMVLRDVTYTSPAGSTRRVLYQANVAQIHVPYDDDGARFHDVSDFGLGGNRLNGLVSADCPAGTLIRSGGKDVFCKTLHDAESLATESEVRTGQALVLFSVSHVGAYNYIAEWRFFDDGTIEPAMGATGRLQRYSDTEEFGWPVRTGGSPVGVSHIHNYYWRLDFDLDGGDDDRIQEIEFVDGANATRALSSTTFVNEMARSVNPGTQRFWRVFDGGTLNGAGRPISYDILPLETGHRDIGPSFEPWTFNDIYATNYRACERFVSHNPVDSADGCAANGNVSDFVSGESLESDDLVVWFGLTFHHTPRDEDEAYMNAHWNRFRLEPRDWLDVGSGNAIPVLGTIADRQNVAGDVVDFALDASDADGDVLTFTANGLPAGVDMDASGNVSGTLTAAGSYAVTVSVADAQGASAMGRFSWSVGDDVGCGDCTNFVAVATQSYGRQDLAPMVEVEELGATLALQDNTWRRTNVRYTVTANTMLEFEFSSTTEGEIHGIGFDNDNVLSRKNIFQLYGTQTLGEQTYNTYEAPDYLLYRIPVGTYYTGTNMALVFVNDNDNLIGVRNDSYFRNVRVYESTDTVPPSTPPTDEPSTGSSETNLALGGVARQSSTLDLGLDFSARHAIDGNRGGNFPGDDLAHTNTGSESWWEVDLGAVYELTSMSVFNREDCCVEGLADFYVFVSDVPFVTDSVSGVLDQSGVSSFFAAGPSARENQFALNRSGRYVRVQLTRNEFLQIAEVEVMGEAR